MDADLQIYKRVSDATMIAIKQQSKTFNPNMFTKEEWDIAIREQAKFLSNFATNLAQEEKFVKLTLDSWVRFHLLTMVSEGSATKITKITMSFSRLDEEGEIINSKPEAKMMKMLEPMAIKRAQELYSRLK